MGGAGHKAVFRISHTVAAGRYTLDGTHRIAELRSKAVGDARTWKPQLNEIFFRDPAGRFHPCNEVLP